MIAETIGVAKLVPIFSSSWLLGPVERTPSWAELPLAITFPPKCTTSGFGIKQGPGPIRENGDVWSLLTKAVADSLWVILPTVNPLMQSPGDEILLLGWPFKVGQNLESF